MESAKARLAALVNGSRPQEIQKANHDLDEARATLANDKINTGTHAETVCEWRVLQVSNWMTRCRNTRRRCSG